MAPEDFQFITKLEPEGCFVLFDDTKPVGIATCISYGKVGWFGNLIVKEEYRGKGAGSLLVKHAIDYLQCEGVETIGLYAYPNLIGFYSNLGFRYDEDFLVVHTPSLGLLPPESLPTLETQQIEKILSFDRKCFGGNRKRLL